MAPHGPTGPGPQAPGGAPTGRRPRDAPDPDQVVLGGVPSFSGRRAASLPQNRSVVVADSEVALAVQRFVRSRALFSWSCRPLVVVADVGRPFASSADNCGAAGLSRLSHTWCSLDSSRSRSGQGLPLAAGPGRMHRCGGRRPRRASLVTESSSNGHTRSCLGFLRTWSRRKSAMYA